MNITKIHMLLSYLSLASVSAAMISPALPLMSLSMHLSNAALSWITAIYLLGYGLGQLIYGPIANRFGRLIALRSGLGILMIGSGICLCAANTDEFILLLMGRLIAAIGAASGLSCTLMMITESLSAKRAAKALAFGPMYFTFGIGGAAFIGGWISREWGWKFTFGALMIHATLMFAMSFVFNETLKKSISLNARTILKGYRAALSSAQLIIFAFCVGVVSIVAYCYSAAAPLYAANYLHLSPGQYGQWNLINMIGMGGSSIAASIFINRMGAKALLRQGFIGAIITMALIFECRHIFPTFVALFFVLTSVTYLFVGVLFSAGTAIASQAIDDKASAASMISFINIGSAFCAVLLMGHLPMNMLDAFILIASITVIVALIATEYFWACKHASDPKLEAAPKPFPS